MNAKQQPPPMQPQQLAQPQPQHRPWNQPEPYRPHLPATPPAPSADRIAPRSGSGGPGPKTAVEVEFPVSPQELAGPFRREFRPAWPYRHRSAQVAAVLYYRGRRPRVIGPEGEEKIWLRWLTRPYSAVELQLGWHTITFPVRLPAAEGGRSFPTEVSVRWQVNDAYTAARSQVSDLGKLLVPELNQRLRDISRGYSIDEAEKVRDAVRALLTGVEFTGRYGLDLDVFVTISPDELTVDHGRNIGRVRHETDLEGLNHRLRLMKNAHEREVIERFASDFQRAMAKGDVALMAEMMARNPDDLPAIRAMFRKEQREERQDVMELMSRLIDGGLLERWELGDQAMVVVEFLRSGTRQALGGGVPSLAPASAAASAAGTGAAATDAIPVRRARFWESSDVPMDEDGSGGA